VKKQENITSHDEGSSGIGAERAVIFFGLSDLTAASLNTLFI
jgi:hypothetical protein